MKKTIISLSAVILATFLNSSFAGSGDDSVKAVKPKSLYITTLIINADVTVVLVNDNEALPEAKGNNSFKKFIRLEKSGDTLTIDAERQRNFLAGTIYVPASQLRAIRVNSRASVRSLSSLQIPNLDVTVNGDCDFNISNVGEVTITGTDQFSFEQYRVVRPLPSTFHKKKF